MVANPDWGAKHLCQDCGAKYYDLNRSPVICPKCGTEFKADTLLRSRRNRTAAAPKPPAPKAPVAVVKAVADGDGDSAVRGNDGDDLPKVKDDAATAPIEDVSELGEDDDDVAEVVTKGDDKEDT